MRQEGRRQPLPDRGEVQPGPAIARIEYANGLVMMFGKEKLKEATKLRAAASKPMDAMERLTSRRRRKNSPDQAFGRELAPRLRGDRRFGARALRGTAAFFRAAFFFARGAPSWRGGFFAFRGGALRRSPRYWRLAFARRSLLIRDRRRPAFARPRCAPQSSSRAK